VQTARLELRLGLDDGRQEEGPPHQHLAGLQPFDAPVHHLVLPRLLRVAVGHDEHGADDHLLAAPGGGHVAYGGIAALQAFLEHGLHHGEGDQQKEDEKRDRRHLEDRGEARGAGPWQSSRGGCLRWGDHGISSFAGRQAGPALFTRLP